MWEGILNMMAPNVFYATTQEIRWGENQNIIVQNTLSFRNHPQEAGRVVGGWSETINQQPSRLLSAS